MSRDDAIRQIVQQVARGQMTRRDAIRRAAGLGISATAIGAALAAPAQAGAQATPQATTSEYVPQGPQVENLLLWTRSSQDTSPQEWDALAAVAQSYTEAVGTPVELVTVPDADFRTKLSQAAPGGEGPDVFGPVAHDWLGEFAIQQIAYPWPSDAIVGVQDVPAAALEAVTVNGEIYGYPLFSETLGFMYYSEVVPEPPATWEDMVPLAVELTEGDTWGFSFNLLAQYYQGAFFHAFGSYIFAREEDGTLNIEDIGLNNEGGVRAAIFLRDIYWEANPPQPEAILDQANAGQFLDGIQEAGNLPMTIAGPWREPPMQAAGIPYGIAPLMTVEGEQLQPFVGYQAFVANAYSEKLDAAIDFINFAGNVDGLALLMPGFGKPPVRESVRDFALELDPNFGIWMDAAERGVPMPNIPQMAEVWTPWGDAMVGIVTNNVPDEEVQALLDAAVEQIRAAIAQGG